MVLYNYDVEVIKRVLTTAAYKNELIEILFNNIK